MEQCENRCVQLVPCHHSANNEIFPNFLPSHGTMGHVGSPKSRPGMKGDYLKMDGMENSVGFAG